jgi:hypothetical protein
MNAIEPNMMAVAWFTILFVVTCVAFFIVAGMFPLSLRPQSAKAPGALLLIGGNLTALLMLAVGTVIYGWVELRWTTLLIGGGLIFLFAPALLESLPIRWRDGRIGLAALLLTQMAGISLLCTVANLI